MAGREAGPEAPKGGQDIERMVRNFEEERSARRSRHVQRVVKVGIMCGVAGTVLAAGTMGAPVLGRLVGEPPAYFLISVGTIVCFSCPVHNLNEVLARNPKGRTVLWAGLVTHDLVEMVFVHSGPIRLAKVPSVCVCVWGCIAGFLTQRASHRRESAVHLSQVHCACCPSQVSLGVLFAFISLGVILATPVEIFKNGSCAPEVVHWCSSFVLAPLYVLLFLRHVLWRPGVAGGAGPAKRTEAAQTLSAYYTYYGYFFFIMGSHWVISGLTVMFKPPVCSKDAAASYRHVNLVGTRDGAAFVLTIGLVVAFGRGRLFGVLAWYLERSFERKQAVQDGLFISTLMDGVAKEEGDVWWVHHGRQDQRYDKHDPRRNWDQARIERIDSREMIVELPGNAVRLTLAMQARPSASSDELLQAAQSEMRCIDWSVIQANKSILFLGKRVSAQAIPTDAMTSLSGGDLFNLSRPVREREEIDFFLSHSWHDSGFKKWEVLQSFVKAFHEHHHRYPTFWLDNVCIDQSKLHEGLRMLPINLMKCRKMLVLCGCSYPFRLWCAWELLTLFAFAQEQQALDRVKLLPLDEGDGFDALACLESFDVRNAHCYDPNDEARLRKVIEAVGNDHFNSRIRALAKALRQPQTRFSWVFGGTSARGADGC